MIDIQREDDQWAAMDDLYEQLKSQQEKFHREAAQAVFAMLQKAGWDRVDAQVIPILFTEDDDLACRRIRRMPDDVLQVVFMCGSLYIA